MASMLASPSSPPQRGSDVTYMPYHEGLVNQNAPPVRASLSKPRASLMSAHTRFGPADYDDDDDDVSDDPPWMNAPRGSLQPAMPSSLLKKTSSGYSTVTTDSTPPSSPPSTDTQASSGDDDDEKAVAKNVVKATAPVTSSPAKAPREDDEDEDQQDYFPPQPQIRKPTPIGGSARNLRSNGAPAASTAVSLRKCKSMHVDTGASPTPTAPVVQLRKARNSRGNSEITRLSFEKKAVKPDRPQRQAAAQPSSSGITSPPGSSRGSSHMTVRESTFEIRDSMMSPSMRPGFRPSNNNKNLGARESMAKYRPSDLTLEDLQTNMQRDSLAPALHPSDLLGSSRNSVMSNSRSNADTMLASSRNSVNHFGPRVTEEGLSNFLRAVKTGNMLMIKACMQDRNTEVTERDPVHGQSALHIAVRFGQFNMVKLLCQKKTRALLIDSVDNRQNTPLHLAAAKSRRITKFLLEQGASVSRVNARNQTPLGVHILTAKRDDPLITEMMLQHKSDPNQALGNSNLMHKAVDQGFYEIAYRLVRHGARLDSKDEKGKMVFDKVNRKIVRELCSRIAYPPVWVPNEERKSCMLCAKKFSRLGVGVRRHHCRHCGRICCGSCSHVSVETDDFPEAFAGMMNRGPHKNDPSSKQRVCKTCDHVFQERAKKEALDGSGRKSRKWSEDFMQKVVGFSWEELNDPSSSTNGSRRGSVV